MSEKLLTLKSKQIHHAERADDRERDGGARDEGGADIAQEYEDHQHDQRDRQHEGELHVVQRLADRFRAVVENVELDASGQLRLEGRQKLANAIDDLDGVGARLPLDRQNDAARLIVPADVLVVLDAVDDGRDLLEADGEAVAVGDNDARESPPRVSVCRSS